MRNNLTVRTEYWKSHIKAYQKSGLKQREYCRRHEISYWSFNSWKRRLEREDNSLHEISPKIVQSLSSKSDKIEISYRDCFRITVTEGFSKDILRDVLSVFGDIR